MISVVVPVYNGEKYLRECLDSVLAQSFSDWEMIVVDDGSTDASGCIADEYASRDNRISVLHIPNGGMSVARNIGIDSARGEYVYFLDSDDIVHPEAFRVLLSSFKDCGVDMAVAGAEISEFFHPVVINRFKFQILSPEKAVKDSLYQKGVLHAPWGKLYKRSILDKVRFTKDLCYEDLDFFYRYCLKCDRVAYCRLPLYFYRQHNESIMHTWKAQRLDVLRVVDEIESFMAVNHPTLLFAARDRKLSANFNIFLLARKHGEYEVAQGCWQVVRKYRFKSLVDSNVRIKNKVGILLSYLGSEVFASVGSLVE